MAVSSVIRSATGESEAKSFRLVNAYSIALTQENGEYQALLSAGGVNFPDGKPVVLALNCLVGRRAAWQVRGPSLFEESLKRAADLGLRNFFLGGSVEALNRLEDRLRKRYPGIL